MRGISTGMVSQTLSLRVYRRTVAGEGQIAYEDSRGVIRYWMDRPDWEAMGKPAKLDVTVRPAR